MRAGKTHKGLWSECIVRGVFSVPPGGPPVCSSVACWSVCRLLHGPWVHCGPHTPTPPAPAQTTTPRHSTFNAHEESPAHTALRGADATRCCAATRPVQGRLRQLHEATVDAAQVQAVSVAIPSRHSGAIRTARRTELPTSRFPPTPSPHRSCDGLRRSILPRVAVATASDAVSLNSPSPVHASASSNGSLLSTHSSQSAAQARIAEDAELSSCLGIPAHTPRSRFEPVPTSAAAAIAASRGIPLPATPNATSSKRCLGGRPRPALPSTPSHHTPACATLMAHGWLPTMPRREPPIGAAARVLAKGETTRHPA